MDAVPCEIENGIFCFYKMKRERPPLFFIYHNADSNKINHLLRIGLYLGYLP